jgi:hypothetical protein
LGEGVWVKDSGSSVLTWKGGFLGGFLLFSEVKNWREKMEERRRRATVNSQ